jgi:O-antigen/teichoic acid export membrane protein
VSTILNSSTPRTAAGHTSGTTPRPLKVVAAPPSGSRSLRRNFAWTIAGNSVLAVSRLAMYVALAHRGGPSMVGEVVLAMAIATPISALAGLGLRGAQVTDTSGDFHFADYLALRLLTAVAALALTGAMASVGDYSSTLTGLIVVMAVVKAVESISEVFRALMQRQERMDHVGLATAIASALGVALMIAGVFLTGSALAGLVGLALGSGVTLLGYDLPVAMRLLRPTKSHGRGRLVRAMRLVRPRWNGATLLRLLRVTLPLGPVALMVSLTPNLPRYVVEDLLGEHALGVFAAIVGIGAIPSMVTVALGQASIARLARCYAEADSAGYWRLLRQHLATSFWPGAVLAALMAIAGNQLLGAIYGEPFAGYGYAAAWLMLASAAQQLTDPLGRGVEAMRRFWLHMLIRMGGNGLMVILLPLMVRSHGLSGAAVAILVSSLVTALCYAAAILVTFRASSHQGHSSWQIP